MKTIERAIEKQSKILELLNNNVLDYVEFASYPTSTDMCIKGVDILLLTNAGFIGVSSEQIREQSLQ